MGRSRPPSIPAALAEVVSRLPDAEAVVDGDVRLTWTELADLVGAAARAFVTAGLDPGDRVAIWAPNRWEWVVALLALQSAGGVVVPLNTRYKGDEAAWILNRSRARMLVTTNGFLGQDYVELLGDQALPGLERIVVMDDGPAPAGATAWADFVAAGESTDEPEVRRRLAAFGPDTVSDLLFTSGTTGRPKGVIQTHGQTLRAFGDWAEVVGLRHDDRYLIVNPFFHAFGYKAGIVACLLTGATMVPLPVFDVPAVMATIPAERISMLPGPPALYQTILAHPDRARLDTSTLRLAVTGAAAIPVSLVERMRHDLGFDTVVTGYGLTEACGIVTMCRHDDDAETIATTSGRAIPGIEVRVVDADGRELQPGEPGEVVVRGYNVMSAYFEEPEQTAEAIDADGWLHTGDIGVLDDRGYLRITDRLKDMIIVGGFNVYPAEVESVLARHPAVGESAVVGAPDDRLGEVAVAFVVPVAQVDETGRADGKAQVDEVALVEWARARMANFKVPRRVHLVDALPHNASGKVLKHELRARIDAGPGS